MIDNKLDTNNRYTENIRDSIYNLTETIDEKEAFEICDFSYWESKTDEAKKKLEKFGSYDYFVSADLGHFMDFIDE